MLSYTIKKGNQTKRVTEFAWRRKYDGKGWDIVDTKGKATEAAQPPALPPTKFEPPQDLVVRLRAKPVVVESAKTSDPIGVSVVAEGLGEPNDPPIAVIDMETLVVDGPVDVIKHDGSAIPEPIVIAAQGIVAKKRGRPAKVKA